MTPWLFKGARLQPNADNRIVPLNVCLMPGVYFAGAGLALGPARARRLARRALPAVAGARPGLAAAAACGWAPGLIQQAWMRLSRVSAPWVDLAAEAGQAAERRLDMAAGAAEPVVEVEMAEGGVEVVAPHQATTRGQARRIRGCRLAR
jgi:hypothetical protein